MLTDASAALRAPPNTSRKATAPPAGHPPGTRSGSASGRRGGGTLHSPVAMETSEALLAAYL